MASITKSMKWHTYVLRTIIAIKSHIDQKNTAESYTRHHRYSTSQSRLRTPQTIPETACGRNDHLPPTSHDYNVALHDGVYHAGRTQDYMGKLSSY